MLSSLWKTCGGEGGEGDTPPTHNNNIFKEPSLTEIYFFFLISLQSIAAYTDRVYFSSFLINFYKWLRQFIICVIFIQWEC